MDKTMSVVEKTHVGTTDMNYSTKNKRVVVDTNNNELQPKCISPSIALEIMCKEKTHMECVSDALMKQKKSKLEVAMCL